MTSSTSLRFKKFAEEGELSIDNFYVTTETLPQLKDGEVKRSFFVAQAWNDEPVNLNLNGAGSASQPLPFVRSNAQNLRIREGIILSRWLIVMSAACDDDPPLIILSISFAAFQLGSKMTALLIGEVEASKSPDHSEGHCVVAWGSWETRSIVPAAAIVLKIDPSTTVPLETYMAVVNTLIGLTAWVGVHRILTVKAGDVVCVSGAAGAVGSLVCQLAHKAGAKVVGICGSKDKCDFVTSLGCSGAINYKTENVKARLAELCPEGFTCYFDNVRRFPFPSLSIIPPPRFLVHSTAALPQLILPCLPCISPLLLILQECHLRHFVEPPFQYVGSRLGVTSRRRHLRTCSWRAASPYAA